MNDGARKRWNWIAIDRGVDPVSDARTLTPSAAPPVVQSKARLKTLAYAELAVALSPVRHPRINIRSPNVRDERRQCRIERTNEAELTVSPLGLLCFTPLRGMLCFDPAGARRVSLPNQRGPLCRA